MLVFEDDRGKITDVSDMTFHGLQMIESKKGTVRSNHYHKKGGHLLYVVSGKMEYVERTLDGISSIQSIQIINAGESIYTGPMLAHKTTFLEDTVLVCLPTMKRTDGGYMDDLVRCVL